MARCEAPVDYELTEHTADLGIAVKGRDWADLLARSALALADLEYDPARVENRMSREVQLELVEGETLLVRWLNELIGWREVEDFLWREVEVEISQTRVRARLHGEPFDASRHRMRSGLKAATYHQLRVEAVAEGLMARVLFDV